MRKSNLIRTIILAGSFLLQLNTLCFHSRGAAGDVDLSFDPGSGVNGTVNAVAVQPDGKVIIAGEFTTVKGLARSGIARLNADGSGDSTFNPGTVANNLVVADMALQPDGKVLICGWNGYAARLKSDGTLDSSFIAEIGSYPYGVSFTSVLVLPDGKVLLGGEFGDVYVDSEGWWPYSRFLVVRLNANGTFDAAGSGAPDYPNDETRIASMALQPDGKVLIAIRSYYTSQIARFNADGSGDPTFNPGTANDIIFSAVGQADGKVLIGGYFTAVNGTNRNGIARLNADGSLDSSFNPGAGANYVISVGLHPDGKVLVGGYFNYVNGTNRKGIARLNANGSLDSSFNPGAGVGVYGSSYPGGIWSFVVQPDGKVLIGGGFTTVNGTNRTRMARLNANGSLDGSFDPGSGIAADPYAFSSPAVYVVAVQPDGKALIGGFFTTVNGTNRNGIARLNANGTLDSSFYPGTGLTNRDAAGNVYRVGVESIVVQPDGKVLIGGYFTAVNGTNRSGIARLNANGSLDSSFNPRPYSSGYHLYALQSNGKVLAGINSGIFRLNADGSPDGSFRLDSRVADTYSISVAVVQPDGKVLIGGYFTTEDRTNPSPARLNADGSLDTSFNPGTNAHNAVYAIALQPDGKVLIEGYSLASDGTIQYRIARFDANGTLDSSFNPDTGIDGNGYPFVVNSFAVQPDGKVLIGGNFVTINGTNRNRIARLNADGSLDSNFDPGTGADGRVRSISLQSDGKVLIGGDFATVNGVARPYVARLYGDSLSPSVKIARSNSFVIVSWPATGLNFQLQENMALLLPNSWSFVAQAAVTNAGQISVTVPTTAGRKFFRLKSQ